MISHWYDQGMVSSLSVVVPAYNEEKNLTPCLQNVQSVLKTLHLDYEIIVVNDGSTDKTGEVAENLKKKIKNLSVVTNSPNRGYGGSLKAGFEKSTKEFIAFFPADNQFDFSQIKEIISKQEQTDADIVSGIRADRHDPVHRKIIGWLWNTIVRAMFGYLASDIDCGFKMFKRKILDGMHLPAERGAMIDTQLFANARAHGYSVAELPLTHLPRTAGSSTGVNLNVMVQSFIDLFKFWWQLKNEILVERGLAVFKWEFFIILAILIVSGFTRLYRINDYMTFLGDEGRDAIAMRDIVTGVHFPLVGPGTSIGNMYLGPLYYYLVAPSILLFNFSPVGPSIFVAFIGVLTIALLWWVGRQWFGRLASLAVATLYAISPTVITYSRSSWNPNVMPFFALLTMYGIWKVWRFGYWRWLVISAVSFAFVLNSHYLGLLLVPTIVLFSCLAPKSPTKSKAIFTSVLLLLLFLSPLFFFDWRHNWQNVSAMKQFFTARQTTVNLKAYKAIPNLWPIWQDMNTTLLAAKNSTAGYFTAFGVFDLAILYLIRKKNSDLKFLAAWIFLGVVGLGLYKQHIYDHYYGFLFPAVFLLVGFHLHYLSSNKYLKIFGIVSFIALVVVSLSKNPLLFPPNKQLERTQEIANFISDQAGGKPFNLALITKSNYDASYRYFLPVTYRTIHQELTDQLFVICEIPDCQPIGNPLWEVAAFGWAKVDKFWNLPWGVQLYKLVHNPTGV